MSDRSQAAAERIREQIPIIEVLLNYGYRVRLDAGDREQQFQCDLHGTGRDNKPSARVYPQTNSWFCWGCGKSRDAIETVKAKEGVNFWGAIKILESSFGLDPLPIDYGTATPGAVSAVAPLLDPARTFVQDKDKVHKFLDNRTRDRDLPLDQLLRFWEKFDEAVQHVEAGEWTEDKGRMALQALLDKIQEALREGPAVHPQDS